MSTALAVVSKSNFLALADNSKELREAMDSIASTGEVFTARDLTRVKTPSGGGVRWEIPDGTGGTESAEAISGILVYVQRSGVLWPSFDPTPGAKPVLRTFDLQTAEQFGPIPDHMVDALEKCRIDERHFNWSADPIKRPGQPDIAGNPYNQWDTGKEGRGKAAREQRVLFILREGDVYPTVVTVQPGSLGSFVPWFKGLVKLKPPVPYWRVVVSLSLEKVANQGGKPYSKIVPKVIGTTDAETGDLVKAKYYDLLAKSVARQVAEETTQEDEE